MKTLSAVLPVALLARSIHAHCMHIPIPQSSHQPLTHTHPPDIFSKLIVNNTLSTDFQYTRDVTDNQNEYTNYLWYKSFPQFGMRCRGCDDLGTKSPAMVCGRNAFPVLNPQIQTATVLAGDDIGFHLSGVFDPEDSEEYMTIYHRGPAYIFLSKLPDGKSELSEYDGSADWFKIGYTGAANSTNWAVEGHKSVNVTIPATTPPGKYLARIEHFMPDWTYGQSQWFISCAHIEVVGKGGGTPGPLVKFPGAYDEEDPGKSSRTIWRWRNTH